MEVNVGNLDSWIPPGSRLSKCQSTQPGDIPTNKCTNCGNFSPYSLAMHRGETFNTAMRPFLLMFLLIGVFPQCGILRKDSRELRFRWLGPETIFSVVLILIGLTMSYVEYEWLDRVGGVNARNIIGIVFFMDTVISTSLLVLLARKWHKLAVHFDEIHKIFSAVSDGKMKNGIHLPIRIAAGVLLTCGFRMWHTLSSSTMKNETIDFILQCNICLQRLPIYTTNTARLNIVAGKCRISRITSLLGTILSFSNIFDTIFWFYCSSRYVQSKCMNSFKPSYMIYGRFSLHQLHWRCLGVVMIWWSFWRVLV